MQWSVVGWWWGVMAEQVRADMGLTTIAGRASGVSMSGVVRDPEYIRSHDTRTSTATRFHDPVLRSPLSRFRNPLSRFGKPGRKQ